jgi:hypothetical protein
MVGRVADDVVKEPGIVNGAELAPTLACTLARKAREWSLIGSIVYIQRIA